METRVNSAKGDKKRKNKFCNKIAEEIWQNYIRG